MLLCISLADLARAHYTKGKQKQNQHLHTHTQLLLRLVLLIKPEHPCANISQVSADMGSQFKLGTGL